MAPQAIPEYARRSALERLAEYPFDYLGVSELAEMLSVTRQVVGNWRSRGKLMLEPDWELALGPVWRKNRVQEWLEGAAATKPITIPPEPHTLAPGGVAMRKTGGPNYLVKEVDGDTITVIWIDGNGKAYERKVHSETLMVLLNP